MQEELYCTNCSVGVGVPLYHYGFKFWFKLVMGKALPICTMFILMSTKPELQIWVVLSNANPWSMNHGTSL